MPCLSCNARVMEVVKDGNPIDLSFRFVFRSIGTNIRRRGLAIVLTEGGREGRMSERRRGGGGEGREGGEEGGKGEKEGRRRRE